MAEEAAAKRSYNELVVVVVVVDCGVDSLVPQLNAAAVVVWKNSGNDLAEEVAKCNHYELVMVVVDCGSDNLVPHPNVVVVVVVKSNGNDLAEELTWLAALCDGKQAEAATAVPVEEGVSLALLL
ncbi:hypothetical protein TorRG33x02_023960 [Trema orientale]|uniref:Uncharacterized protein n=1 Tax=Trema orientale TaxID=63057 RepID=A0A2P5FV05_TREOI|nr:hypothetical protein TorRG33x02_023960 [Trema orientale]